MYFYNMTSHELYTGDIRPGDRVATSEEVNAYEQALAEAQRLYGYRELRARAHPPILEVVEALIELQEGRNEKWQTVQAQRLAVKARTPWPSPFGDLEAGSLMLLPDLGLSDSVEVYF
jgi:hypothetical protein